MHQCKEQMKTRTLMSVVPLDEADAHAALKILQILYRLMGQINGNVFLIKVTSENFVQKILGRES
jgi:hypothetical protein